MAKARDELLDQAHENRVIVAWLMGPWSLAFVAYALWIRFRYTIRSDLNCEVPGMDSTYGESSWGWLPPGETCTYPHYPAVASTRPGWVVPAFLVVLPLVVIGLWVASEVRVRRKLRGTA